MKNFVQPGNVLTATAPSGGVKSGTIQVVGEIIGVAATSAAEGAEYELSLGECYEVPKTTGAAWAMGQKLYFDAATKRVTTTVGSNKLLGVAAQSAASAAAIGVARFNSSF